MQLNAALYIFRGKAGLEFLMKHIIILTLIVSLFSFSSNCFATSDEIKRTILPSVNKSDREWFCENKSKIFDSAEAGYSDHLFNSYIMY